MDLDLEKLKREEEENLEERHRLAFMAALGDNLGNRQSFGNYFLGRMNPKDTTMSDYADRKAKALPDSRKRLSEDMALKSGAASLKATEADMAAKSEERALQARMRDPNSAESLAEYKANAGLHPNLQKALVGMSAEQIREHVKNPLVRQRFEHESQMALARAKAKQEGAGNPNKYAFDHLPVEDQEAVKDLGKAKANAMKIRNLLAADMKVLNDPNVSDEQKLTHANSMLKTLNSKIAQDVVGAEEASRLAPWLKPQGLKALWGPGKAIGYDLNEFAGQVGNTMKTLDDTIASNEESIKNAYAGKREIGKRYEPAAPRSGGNDLIPDAHASGINIPDAEKKAAMEWAANNPDDPRAARILESLGRN